ncbi:MAG: hypothetical protein K2X48_13860 [Chitinophagaceae bacterium]|nr:hypothetical protein [Chitinophagaceae bacterium]
MQKIHRLYHQLFKFSFFFLCIGFITNADAQTPLLSAEEWAKKLSDTNPESNHYIRELRNRLTNYTDRNKFVSELEKKGEGIHFRARLNLIKAFSIYFNGIAKSTNYLEPTVQDADKKEINWLLDLAIQEAYRSNDDYLIAGISIDYGHTCSAIKELEAAMMYMINGVELNEKIQAKNAPGDYMVLGELLYKIKEYSESAKYSIKAIKAYKSPHERMDSIYIMWANNTAALGYHRQLIYDSAFIYYNNALQMAHLLNLDLWEGIVGGNMGQIYYAQKKYETALPLLLKDYTISKQKELFDNAANSLQWAARTELATGNKTTALQYLRESFSLLAKSPDAFYLRNCYYAATETYKAMGVLDSAYYYNKQYEALNDSLERVIALSSIKISKIRFADEQNRFNIKTLQREKEKQVLLRNILIAAILMLTALALLFYNRQQLKNRLKMQSLELEKQRVEQEAASAQEQMKMFTGNILEKTALIEKLEEQLRNKNVSAEQQSLMSELSRQTILTEEDWNQFKTLFEKIYPGFFINLKQKVPDITLAEQRMSALTRLQLTTKQMAAMLGISVDSVHKTRQRLRQRLQLSNDINLETYITNI